MQFEALERSFYFPTWLCGSQLCPKVPLLALSLTLGCPPVPVPKGPPPALGGSDGPWLVAVHLLSPETATSCFSANAYPLDLPPTLLGVCQPEYTAVSAGDSVTSS